MTRSHLFEHSPAAGVAAVRHTHVHSHHLKPTPSRLPRWRCDQSQPGTSLGCAGGATAASGRQEGAIRLPEAFASVAGGGEAERLLDRVVQNELNPDDADHVHQPRLPRRSQAVLRQLRRRLALALVALVVVMVVVVVLVLVLAAAAAAQPRRCCGGSGLGGHLEAGSGVPATRRTGPRGRAAPRPGAATAAASLLARRRHARSVSQRRGQHGRPQAARVRARAATTRAAAATALDSSAAVRRAALALVELGEQRVARMAEHRGEHGGGQRGDDRRERADAVAQPRERAQAERGERAQEVEGDLRQNAPR